MMEETNNYGWVIPALIFWGGLMRFAPAAGLAPFYFAWIALDTLILTPLKILFRVLTRSTFWLLKKVTTRKLKAPPQAVYESEEGIDWNNTIRGRNLAKRGINHAARIEKLARLERKAFEREQRKLKKEQAEQQRKLEKEEAFQKRRQQKESKRLAAVRRAEKKARREAALEAKLESNRESRLESKMEANRESKLESVSASALAAGAAGAAGTAWASDDDDAYTGGEDIDASLSCTMVNPSTGCLMECGSGIDSGGYMLGEDVSGSLFDDDSFSSFDDTFSSFDDDSF